jgi:hypothetical protein
MTEPQETHTWEPCSTGVSVEVEVADVYLHGHQVDEIIIESLQEKLENLEAEDSEKNKEYIAAFEMVIDWHGG